MATVSLQHVGKTYPGGTVAVRAFSLDVADGEFVVLVGPSGCGKSTTLRMIAGLEEVTEGDIRIGERSVTNVPPAKRDVAMVFQDYALYPHMSVRQNMAFGLKMRRTPRVTIDQQVERVAAMLDIAPLLDRRPRELSGGQRQRVALGRAIVRSPQVFLFDEPLSNLDAQLRVQMRTELAALHRELDATMIYVTHDQTEAMTLGDRLVLMNEGRIEQVAPPLEVYNRPATRFVATFIGSPPMNLFAGRVADGALVLDGANGAKVVLDTTCPAGPAVLGIRPEDLRITGDGIPVADGIVRSIEYLGHETLAQLQVGEHTALVRLDRLATVEVGADIFLTVRPRGMHLFTADDSGRRIG